MKTIVHFWSYLAQSFLEWEMFQTICRKNQNIHFMFNNFFFFLFENLAIYEIMWKNVVEPNRPQITVWRMRIASWLTKATNALS
jgi:hypothetical protein